MPYFTKRPVMVEAHQWDGSRKSAEHILAWAGPAIGLSGGGNYLVINTLEGQMYANPNDWIIHGVAGEFYPCKPDIFEATYERTIADADRHPVL